MSFNINKKSISESTRLHLEDPETGLKMYADDAKTQPLEISIYGKASKQYRQALSDLSRKALARKNKSQSFETNVEDNIDILVAISIEAHNFTDDDAQINTPEAFRKLYRNNNLYWIKDQVQSALESDANFLAK